MPDWLSLCAISLLLSIFTVALATYFVYSGLLSDVEVLTGSPPIKKITIVYKFIQGPYQNCGQVFKESRSIGPKLPCVGVFYDDPKKVPGPQCRSAVGSIVSEGENKASEDLIRQYKTSGFNVYSFPEVTHVVTASFPHRTFFSIILGVRRVYPQLARYIKERRLCAHPFLEIYREGQIQFIAPLARQGDFYVPEVRQVERQMSTQEDSHSESDVSGAESNSEYSFGSGILLSDSRESSIETSSVHSRAVWDQDDRRQRGRSSGAASAKGLDWDTSGGHTLEKTGETLSHDESDQKSDKVSTQELWGVVGEEE